MKLPHTPACVIVFDNFGDNFGRDDRPARPRTRPDLRSELPRLPADLPEHRGFLLRVPLSNDGAVCGVGLGPLRAMRGQSIFWRAECRAQQAAKTASAQLILLRAHTNAIDLRPGLRPTRAIAAITSRKCRARAASMGPWRFASCRASGSAGRLRSRRRSRPCCGPTARRRTHCIAPRSSARQDTKFDAKRRTVHPQSRRLVFPDTAPAHTSNVSALIPLWILERPGFHRRSKPDCEFRVRNRRSCA